MGPLCRGVARASRHWGDLSLLARAPRAPCAGPPLIPVAGICKATVRKEGPCAAAGLDENRQTRV